jgi:hypothetical protein
MGGIGSLLRAAAADTRLLSSQKSEGDIATNKIEASRLFEFPSDAVFQEAVTEDRSENASRLDYRLPHCCTHAELRTAPSTGLLLVSTMSPKSSPSPLIIIHDTILKIVQAARCQPSKEHAGLPLISELRRLDETDKRFSRQIDPLSSLTAREEAERSEKACLHLLTGVHSTPETLQALDHAFSELLEFNIVDAVNPDTIIADHAHHILLRLPSLELFPKQLDHLIGPEQIRSLPDACFTNGDKRLRNMVASRLLSRNLIAVAVQATLPLPERRNPRIAIQPVLDMVMELLEALVRLSHRKSFTEKMVILTVFLLQTWHRILCLHRWGHLGAHLHHGTSAAQNNFLEIRGQSLLRDTLTAAPASMDIPPYMCKWAFELVRTDRANVGADFSPLLDRFAKKFGLLPPRCVFSGVWRQCDGLSPAHCMRFTGARIEDQSAHVVSCSRRCRSLYWNEKSYRAVVGTRAVLLGAIDDLRYCSASERTLAISHVWSHGQGGRIDGSKSTGFNECLHARYSTIAHSFGCDSYWMDTPCIPEEHSLRREAIIGINPVFTSATVVLVCDRDLMAIDVSSGNVHAYEELLSTLLVCDWNVRAWTLLEAVKGAEALHLLCLNDQVIRLSDVLRIVHAQGDMALANLCLAANHLLPKSRVGYNGTLESTGAMLNHRHASRTGDEIVIWSLLLDTTLRPMPLCTTAEQFWRNRQSVNTAFLVSDVPRIRNVPGLSWAPSRPDFPLDYSSTRPSRQFAYEGDGSALAIIYQDIESDGRGRETFTGIHAEWLMCRLHDIDLRHAILELVKVWFTALLWVLNVPRLRTFIYQRSRAQLQELEWRFDYFAAMCRISASTRGELRRIKDEMSGGCRDVALLRPMQRRVAHNVVYDSRGFEEGFPMVLVTSRDGHFWTWERVIEWDREVPLPPFRRETVDIE